MQLCCSFALRHCRVRCIFLTRAVVPLREIGCRGQERGRAVRWHDRSFLPGEGHRRGRAEETEDLGGRLVYDRETLGLGRSSHRAERGGGRTGRAWPRREAHGDRFRQDSGKDWRRRAGALRVFRRRGDGDGGAESKREIPRREWSWHRVPPRAAVGACLSCLSSF